jgi:predicted amidohydrolase
MRLALAQYALGTDAPNNLDRVLELMRDASRQEAQMITFPELCLSPFFPQFAGTDASKYAMRIEDPCIRHIQSACKTLGLAASPNVYLREGKYSFDASLMIGSDGEIQGISKMVHIAQLPGFYEQDYYTPSDTGFRVFDTGLAKVGIVVCFDRHFPESTRVCTLRGAQLIIIPTANTLDEPRDLFECEVRTAAMQNGAYIAMCNRVGTEGDVVFCGESIVVDPDGTVVFKAGSAETLAVVDIDLSRVEAARRKRPYLSLRRPELYGNG